MKIFLTLEERIILIALHRKEKNRCNADRIKAVLLRDSGWNYSEIANALFIDDETASSHVKEYRKKKKLKNNSGGKEPKLSEKQSQELIIHLDMKTYLCASEINMYVFEQYHIFYSISVMQKWLKNNGFGYKKTHPTPAKACKKKQADFNEAYQYLKSNLSEKEVILFGDACHPSMQTKLSYGWIRTGKNKNIKTQHKELELI